MLQISRKFLALPFNQVYFHELKCESRFEPKIIRYTHLLKPSRQLQRHKTIHIDLCKGEQTLLESMSTSISNLLQNSSKEKWRIEILDNPTDEEIFLFQNFFNRKEKEKNGRRINKFDIQTLKLLRNQGALIVTKLKDEENETICYRLYVVDGVTVMSLFENGYKLLRLNDQHEHSAIYLCWENMKRFSKLGYQIYDFGDIKESKCLEEIKESFGGEIVTVFSGYISKSRLSNVLLQFNLLS